MAANDEAPTLFLVRVTRGGPWDWSVGLRQQAGFDEHAHFMDALVSDGYILLGGPLEGGRDVVHVIHAASEQDIRDRLALDPWSANGMGVGALRIDGKLFFTSGLATRKSRHLRANPRCSVSLALTGLDLVIEGTAAPVTDEQTLARLAEQYRAQGWPATVAGGAHTAPYSAPSAGPPPWYLYALTPETAFGVATTEPFGASRWRFP